MQETHSFKELYMILDNGTLTFAANPIEVLLLICNLFTDELSVIRVLTI